MDKRNTEPTDALDRALTQAFGDPVPASFHASWRAAVKREEKRKMKKNWGRIALSAAAALVLLVAGYSIGNSTLPTNTMPRTTSNSVSAPRTTNSKATSLTADSASYAANDALYLEESTADSAAYTATGAGPVVSGTGSTDATALPAGSKLVRTADVTIVTSAFDADVETIRSMTEAAGGYIESVSSYGDKARSDERTTYFTLRIPSAKLDGFLGGLDGVGRTTSRNESAVDRSNEYSDTATRLETQRAKLERLNQLLKQATDMSDLLEIENTIADTQYMIDRYETALRGIDRDVDNSTVSLTVREELLELSTETKKELTLGELIANGLQGAVKSARDFFRNLAYFFSYNLLWLLPLVAIVVIVLVVRKRRKARKPATKDGDEGDE